MAKNKTNQELASQIFTLVLLFGALFLSYLLFRPYLVVIILASVLVAIFYPLYKKILYYSRGMVNISSVLVCLLILFIIIAPFTYFVFFLAQKAIEAYASISPSLNKDILSVIDKEVIQRLSFVNPEIIDLRQTIVDLIVAVRGWAVAGATFLIRGTTDFFFNLILLLFTMYFLFIDGPSMLRRLMRLTPLSNKYDLLIWQKFRDVSFSVIVSTFVTSIAQAVVAAIGFVVIGIPVLIPAILIAIASLIPYVGTVLIWGPIGVYLVTTGSLWQGIFILVWGALIIGLVDNVLRPYLIKGKAKVHPLIIFFSIIGGIAVMGFWGIVFGPLIVSLAVTLLHIYELEFKEILER